MKRVLCLYRVSTKGQVDKTDDIPMQRRECMDFISRMNDWEFYDERMEKGVSGYKVSADKRDAIVEIRAMAEKKMFDVLLVFMFDRLGRREDETPLVVQWFIEHGIEVWSTREGQQRIDNRADKLINYIRFWQAGGESEKTSMRVKASHTQMTADGIWRGGKRPYGYKLVHKGRIGKKNRPLYDLEIDEVEGPIVLEVFDLCCKQGYGTLRAANYLNAKYPNPDKIWTAQTIRNMLRNPLYTGRMHMNDTLSEPLEHLRLVSDSDFEFASRMMESRIPFKYMLEREAENAAMPVSAKTKASVYGATLLSGILHCAHCGHKLVGGYATKQRAAGAYHRPIYRCYNGATKAKGCGGQSVYSAAKVEEAVLEVVRQYFHDISHTVDSVWKEQTRRQMRSKQASRLKAAQRELEKLTAQQTNLKKEVLKSMTGDSVFEPELLKELLAENRAAIAEAEATISECQTEKETEDARIRHLTEQYNHITDWAKEFDGATTDEKKMILARIIERVTVDRDYHITITFFISSEDFTQSIELSMESLTIEESSRIYRTLAS